MTNLRIDLIRTNIGCHCCLGRKVVLSNCLATVHPEVANLWHPTKNGNLTLYDITCGTDKMIWFRCPISDNHKWFSVLNNVVNGSSCPECSESRGEKEIVDILSKMDLKFEREVKFKTCKNKKRLPFDFLVKVSDNFNILIEYQGYQHYEPTKWGKSMSYEDRNILFNNIQMRDKIKMEWARDNNIPLLIIPYWKKDKMEQIINNFLKERIKSLAEMQYLESK